MVQRFALAATLALTATVGHAGEILVPGDQPNLQAAILAAADGDVILVRTPASQGVVTIDRPLTILGDPIVNMGGTCTTGTFQLAGPGSGTVVLQNVNATGGFDCYFPGPPIAGGGFDALHVYDSELRPAFPGQSGLGNGGHGIDTTVPFVLLERVVVEGRGPGSDHCAYGSFPNPGGWAGVHAPDSTVCVLDSDVRGGRSWNLCCEHCWCYGFPPADDQGVGGPGIVADEVFTAGSTILGGEGISLVAWTGNAWQSVMMSCGAYADGPALVTSTTRVWNYPAHAPSEIPLGGTWTIEYEQFGGPVAALYFGFDLTPPVPVTVGNGWTLIDPATATFVGAFPTGFPNSITFPIPNLLPLANLEVGFQFAVGTTASRPIFGVLRG